MVTQEKIGFVISGHGRENVKGILDTCSQTVPKHVDSVEMNGSYWQVKRLIEIQNQFCIMQQITNSKKSINSTMKFNTEKQNLKK